jgi:iron complex transport system substrate-binding protein
VDARHIAARRRTATLPALLALSFVLVAACAAPAASITPPATSASAAPSLAVASSAPPPSATPSPTPAPSFPLTLTDDEGTTLTVPKAPARIVSLTPAATETLFALGLGERIVARSEDPTPYPQQAASIPVVARFDGVDVEKVVALEPDLVIAGGNFFTPADAIAKLRAVKIPVLVVYAPSVAAVTDDIDLIGEAAGRPAEAEAISTRIETEFDGVRAAVATLPKPRVFYELDATGAIYGPADKSFLAEMIGIAGGTAITTGSPDKYDIPVERLVQADPEIILLADAPYGVKVADVAKRAGWSVMTAVKQRAIVPIDDTMITRPGPRIFLGLQQLAAAIHPGAPVPSSSPIPAQP